MTTETAARVRGAGRGAASDREAPRQARRLQRPGWRDLRLVVGLLLILLSVAGGARLVTGLDDTTPVYAAARDLLPGQPVSAQDVVAVDVRLGEGCRGTWTGRPGSRTAPTCCVRSRRAS
ncbi:hypothetical protein [Ornithinimicrobium flavum]|uniref:hypothetical protein n=1 Tax=Ornithinimicrobium flavum TaxID=1288636 RepID=UPI00106FD70F|nr:hypothetical protein [Ornithinimicrobium flavum]